MFTTCAEETFGWSLVFSALSSKWQRGPVKLQGSELAAISVALSDFQNLFEVATGPNKNEGNLARGIFFILSCLFSLFSVLLPLPSVPR